MSTAKRSGDGEPGGPRPRLLVESGGGSPLLSTVGLDDPSRRQRLAFLDYGPADDACLTELHQFALEHVDAIVDEFYAHLLNFEETRDFLRDPALVTRLKKLQREYFLRLTSGKLDAEYFESRLRVGAAHARINLRPEWYLGTYNLYLRLVIERLRTRYADEPARLTAMIAALTKVVFLDMGLAIDAYIWSGYVDRALAQEYRRVAEVAERTLREKDDLERAKADLTNMIVHDLKGPLGGILTVAQLALRKREGLSDAHAERFAHIQRSARDLMRMIENILEIDQMEEGRLTLRAEPVDLALLLRECANDFRAAAEVAGQTIELEVGEDLSAVVTDRWLLRRVLNNLVVNAIRHSGASGAMVLETAQENGVVAVRVRDIGRGMTVEEQAALFSRARPPATDSRQRSPEDTGLGLVFCKMAVEVMSGTITVDSTPGAGTVFTITLPIAAAL
jgi:signal transduction histidine kinase